MTDIDDLAIEVVVGNTMRVGNHQFPADENALRLTTPFTRNLNGTDEVFDPNTVEMLVWLPGDVTLEYDYPIAGPDGIITREGPGRYFRNITFDVVGRTVIRIIGIDTTNNIKVAHEWIVNVVSEMLPQ
jgi:hypothetical protein